MGHPDTITVHGYVYDGEGDPLPDALLEVWGPDPEAASCRRPTARCGATRRPAASSGATVWSSPASAASRPTPTATGTRGRCGPGPAGPVRRTSACACSRAACSCTCLPDYLPGDEAVLAADPLLSRVDAERRDTLVATDEGAGTYRLTSAFRAKARRSSWSSSDISCRHGPARPGWAGSPAADATDDRAWPAGAARRGGGP